MSALRFLPLLFVAPAVGALTACQDAVHDQEVSALGGEAPGVSPGPDHRPGQPCTVCHGGQGPAKVTFTVAGTIFMDPGANAPAVGAEIQLEDANGNYFHVQTNNAGNFYLQSHDWSPTFPISVPVLSYSSSGGMPLQQSMITNDNRDGSCASCHALSPSFTSPGPIYVNSSRDGG